MAHGQHGGYKFRSYCRKWTQLLIQLVMLCHKLGGALGEIKLLMQLAVLAKLSLFPLQVILVDIQDFLKEQTNVF